MRVYYTLALEWWKCNKTDIFSTPNHITLWLWICFSIPIKCKLIRNWEKKRDWQEGWWGLGALELSYIAGRNVDIQTFWKAVQQCLTSSVYLTRDWTTPLLGIYLRTMKMYIHIKTCTQKFITAWFIIAKNSIAIQMSIKWWMSKF